MKSLFFLTIFALLSLLFSIATLVFGIICSYKNPTKEKSSIYECGVKLFSDARIKYDVRFFNYAILFLLFDVEVIFLYPFAINLGQLKTYAIAECFIFTLILLFGIVYAIKQKILRWK